MKTIPIKFNWTNKLFWSWPDNDTELLKVVNQVADIEKILKYVPETRRNLCVQAGGGCGIWPLKLSSIFDLVYTFEPNKENFLCLENNLSGIKNIVSSEYALSNLEGTASMHYDIENNSGAGYILSNLSGKIKTVTLDSQNLNGCDLLQLDVEGHELECLQGAKNLIKKYSPTICLEVKLLPYMRNKGIDHNQGIIFLINTFNYKIIDYVNRDIILVPENF